jgi:hypothetical protein
LAADVTMVAAAGAGGGAGTGLVTGGVDGGADDRVTNAGVGLAVTGRAGSRGQKYQVATIPIAAIPTMAAIGFGELSAASDL